TTRTERKIDGLATRRSRGICDLRATTWRGIPVTTIPQILVDLAPTLSLDDLARVCHEAHVRGTRPEHVEAIMRRNAPGTKKLRAVLRGDIPVTLSQLEKRFLALLEEHGLPVPHTNIVANERRVDCRWPDHHLTV